MNARRTSRLSASVVLIAGFALAPAARAAVDSFIWFEDGSVKGESRDARHRDWIEVVSTDFVASSPRDAATGQASGKRQFKPFHIVKRQDASTPALDQAFSSGRVFPNVTIEARGARWSLTDVKITGIQKHPAGGGEAPTESLTLTYGSIKWTYGTQEGPGSPKATPTASKALLSAAVSSGAVTAPQAPRITGVSASAPFLGTAVTVVITSTGPCANAFVGYGDGSINEGHALTGASTQIPAHVYSTPGVKTIQVGGYDAPYWSGPQKHGQRRANDCTGWAETKVTLRSEAAPAPALKR